MPSYETDDFVVEWKDDEETRNEVFNKLVGWYVKMESFNGESICQMDAPNILAELADEVFKFKTEWK